jgi:serine/threonine-protein kinase
VSIDDLLAAGEERADALASQPEVQAALRHALGRIRMERGDAQRARELLGAARDAEVARLGDADPDIVRLRVHYARALHATGGRDEAERELRETLALLEAAPERDPALEAGVLQGLGMLVPGEEGLRALERAVVLEREREDRDPVDLADMLTSLAVRRSMAGDPEGARALYAEALPLLTAALGPEAPRTLAARSNLARYIEDPQARADEQSALLEIRRRRLGEESYPVANSWIGLGLALSDLGRHAEAEAAFRQGLGIWTKLQGPDYRMTLYAQHHLARCLARQGRLDEADGLYAQLEAAAAADRLDDATATAVRAERAELRASSAPAGGDAPVAATSGR